jgi:hypothetical protein
MAGITDTRIAPSHSWRHRFETKVRDLNIREDISNRLTGDVVPNLAGILMNPKRLIALPVTALSRSGHSLAQ